MRKISRDFGWALVAAVVIWLILAILGVEHMPGSWWIVLIIGILGVILMVFSYWPKGDSSGIYPDLIFPNKRISTKPGKWQRFKKWFREN